MTATDNFAREVLRGLTSYPKKLPSKLLYDERGSQLFQQIMQLPEYYPTDCETEIFNEQAESIVKSMSEGAERIQLIELGAGDGSKTRLLLSEFVRQGVPVIYRPIDISAEANRSLVETLQPDFPDVEIAPITGEYFEAMSSVASKAGTRRVALFLGSNIGNFTPETTKGFLSQFRENLSEGDLALIGFDLRKDPQTILNAYNDSQGVTAAFNFNVLERINKALGANFELDNFLFWPLYDPEAGAVRSYLVSKSRQVIHLKTLNQKIKFAPYESIHTETSRKYSLRQIEGFAEQHDFQKKEVFYDRRDYFADVLWRVR
ncbi:MAG: L-histidine N(alpha)-methyltransferase [Bacteroidota bacterium]